LAHHAYCMLGVQKLNKAIGWTVISRKNRIICN